MSEVAGGGAVSSWPLDKIFETVKKNQGDLSSWNPSAKLNYYPDKIQVCHQISFLLLFTSDRNALFHLPSCLLGCWISLWNSVVAGGGGTEYALMIWDPFKDSCKDQDSCTQRKHDYHRWWKRAHLSFYTRQTCVIERSQPKYWQWRSMWYQEASDWAKVNLIVLFYTDTTARVLQREVLIKDFLLLLSVSTCVQVYLTVCEQQQMPSRGLKLLTPKPGLRTFPRYLPINKHRIVWSLQSSLLICWMCNFLSLVYVCCYWK